MKKANKKKKVIVGLSGGVDSSVSAALLKRAGFEVVGVFMKFWSEPGEGERVSFNRCCSLESEVKAREVAKALGIPFYVFNFEGEFKKRIVDYFLKEYETGNTPNPCVLCNKEIKFGLLLEKSLALGADYIATGHYARLKSSKAQKKTVYSLLKGKDKDKDQSYFLWQLSQKQLKHIIFPVGNHTKGEVRKLAERFNLPTARTPESMEVCFVKDTINDFLGRHLKQKPGKTIDSSGKVLGSHQGLSSCTIGQRKGVGLPNGPYYVLRKDAKNNILVVTKKEKDLLSKKVSVRDVSWIAGIEPKMPLMLAAKIRYRHKAAQAALARDTDSSYSLKFNTPQRAVTPGQSVVFYRGEELLGGGIIS